VLKQKKQNPLFGRKDTNIFTEFGKFFRNNDSGTAMRRFWRIYFNTQKKSAQLIEPR